MCHELADSGSVHGVARSARGYADGVRISILLASALAPLASDCAQAAGFFIGEQSVRGIGRANAGAAAVADDPSTVFWNPAGLTELPGAAAVVAGHYILARTTVEDRGSAAATPGTAGAQRPLAGPDGKPFDPTAVFNAYAAAPIMDRRVWFGLGAASPFGLVTEYDAGYFGRYDSIESKLFTVDIMPSFAFAATKWLSIGAGIDIQYANAKLVNAIPNPLSPGGPTPATDARSSVEGDAWSLGYNFGVLVKPSPQTRVGAHYRSAIDHDLEGDLVLSGFRGPLAGLNGTSGGSAQLKLPNIVSLGGAVDLSRQLTVLGQVWWFGWDRFDEIRIKLTNDPREQVRTQNYRNSFTFAIGTEYRLGDAWTLRSGFQYDQTPTVDAFRNTGVPDGDRFWLALGASYRLSRSVAFDVAYAHLFVRDGSIDRTQAFFEGSPLASAVRTQGKAEGSGADILSVQLRLDF